MQHNQFKPSMTQAEFIAASVALAKQEIMQTWADGGLWHPDGKVMPLTVTTFSELHDYCDANELGALCNDDVLIIADKVFGNDRAADECSDAWHDACNTIQNTVGEWLRATVDERIARADHLAEINDAFCSTIDAMEEARGTANEGDKLGALSRAEYVRDAARDSFLSLAKV